MPVGVMCEPLILLPPPESANNSRGRPTDNSVSDARNGIGRLLDFDNRRRPHSSLANGTPDQAYLTQPCSTKARPTRLAAEPQPTFHLATRENRPNDRDHLCAVMRINGAQKRTRTSTPFPALAPEASASTNSAIWASCTWRLAALSTEPPGVRGKTPDPKARVNWQCANWQSSNWQCANGQSPNWRSSAGQTTLSRGARAGTGPAPGSRSA